MNGDLEYREALAARERIRQSYEEARKIEERDKADAKEWGRSPADGFWQPRHTAERALRIWDEIVLPVLREQGP